MRVRRLLVALSICAVVGLAAGAWPGSGPALANPLTDAAATTAGGDHTCVLTTAGGVRCWGWNVYGQLGDGTTTNRTRPVEVAGLTSGVAVVAAGDLHNCALTTAGGVACWGRNVEGQLGDGTTTQRTTPVDVAGLTSGVATVAGGGLYTCALTTAGGAKCWGYNGFGQLGDGTTTQRTTPVDVLGLTGGVDAIAAGDTHTCVLTAAGGVACWGDNFFGQLGDGTTTQRTTPVDVSGLRSGVVAIAAGINHTCALTTAGGVKCWGRNLEGQLGDGTTTDRTNPVDVTGLASGVAAVTAGGGHTCALTAAGGATCWGHNVFGQLGEGTTTDRTTPVDVSGLASGVAALATGDLHTCALTTAGGVACWGRNVEGQLGDGTTTQRTIPVDVSGPVPKGTPPPPPPPPPGVPVQTLTRDGFPSDCPDNVQAQSCRINGPRGLHRVPPSGGGGGHGLGETAGSSAGALYFADTGNNKIKKIESPEPTGIITTVAGTGTPGFGGDGGDPTAAQLNGPRDVFIDTSGDMYIADTGNCRVRRVVAGIIETVAGNGTCGFGGDGGPATSAQLNFPAGVAVDGSGNIYIADTENCRVRKVSGGTITTVAGNGTCGFGGDAGDATEGELNRPHDVYFLLPSEDLVIADTGNNRIRRLDLPAGIIVTLAGTGIDGFSGDGRIATRAQLSGPQAVAASSYRVFIADTGNDRIRRVDVLSGIIDTVAGEGGLTTPVVLDAPAGVAIGSIIGANTNRHALVAAGIDPNTGQPERGFRPTQSCDALIGASSIDWALPALLLGLLLARKQFGALLFRLRSAGGCRPSQAS